MPTQGPGELVQTCKPSRVEVTRKYIENRKMKRKYSDFKRNIKRKRITFK